MRIDLYVEDEDGTFFLEAKSVTLESCFPDANDPDMQDIAAILLQDKVAYYGGGASPLFKFVPAK